MSLKLPIGIAILMTMTLSNVTNAEERGDWGLSEYQQQSVKVAVATNRKTGHKMHVIKLKDGSLMAIVPAMPLWDMMRDAALSDVGN